jgi:thiosulfate/3-mercaptopyruvate sulfurtransferase
MKISKWFIQPEDLFGIENVYLLNVTEEVTSDIETDENENFWKYRSLETIRDKLLHRYRISQDTFVVLYTSDLLMAAARVAWLLHWIGCDQIRILIGQIDPSLIFHQSSLTSYLPEKPLRSEVRITCSDLFDEFSSTTTSFIDVRTYAEYSGQITGYPYVRYTGRIPLFEFDCLNGIYGNIPGTISWEELENYLLLMSQTSHFSSNIRRIIYMCGTGWRASLAAIFADVLGFAEVITVLDSGWFEWSERFLE